MIKNIFSTEVSEEVISRIGKIQITDKPLWGKMNAAQMFAHCNVTYTYTFDHEQFKKPGFLQRFLMKLFVKGMVVGEKPYKKNSPTASYFLVSSEQDFEAQKTALVENIRKVQRLGEQHFEGLANFSFGPLTAQEWNNLFYKHLDHHLQQFGV